MDDKIIPGSRYGDVRKQAQAEGAHGLSGAQIEQMAARMDAMLPKLTREMSPRVAFEDALPEGASWSPQRTGQSIWGPQSGNFSRGPNGSGGNTMVTQQRPYQPEFESQDRQQFPVHRILANRYWRLFYKLDPVIGNALDMYGEMPWSDFQLSGDGIDGEVRDGYERMCELTKLLTILPYLIKEYLVIGEVVPHCFYDDIEGLWTYIALHNPDQLEVVDAPFIKMDPIVEFIPDDRLRTILTSERPALQRIRDSMPPELLSRLYARQNVPLSSLNATFIARKLHPYDVRGTSIITRMWRVLMYEDAIFNASISTARRSAAPLKVAKLGNAATGWIPGPEHEARLLQLLAQAELDPQSWLVYNYGIAFELIGNNDRLMSINTHWDMIERVKLIAMGISKSFVHGEVSYASASTGLQVFLTRLKALRTFFEQVWIYPKFFRPIAEMNGWTRSTPAEISHHFRVKRSQREMVEQNRYILPKIVWDKTLDPQVNANLINAMQVLEGLGCKFSKTTKMATIGSNYEAEQKKIKFEEDFERQFLPKKKEQAPDENKPAGGGSVSEDAPPPSPSGDGETGDGGAPPPAPGAAPGDPAAAPAAASAGEGEENKFEDVEEEPTPTEANSSVLKSKIWTDDKFGNWAASEAEGIVELFREGETESAFWDRLVKKHSDGQQTSFMRALYHREYDQALNVMDDFLEGQGYPEVDVQALHHILEMEGCIGHPESSRLVELEKSLPDDTDGLDDATFDTLVATTYSKAQKKLPSTPDKVISTTEKKAKKIKKMSDSEFLVGGGSLPMDASGGLNGDISGLLPKG